MPFGIDVGYETGYYYPTAGMIGKRATPREPSAFAPRPTPRTRPRPVMHRQGLPPGVGVGAGAGALLPAGIGAVAGATMAEAGLPVGMSQALAPLAATGVVGAAPMALFGDGAVGAPWWFEGPFLEEPPSEFLVKEWHRTIDAADGDFRLQYYLVKLPNRPYRIWMYNTKTKVWKSWGIPKPAVIGKNMPSHKMLTRLRRNLKKHAADAKTILMVAQPTTYAKQLGYRKYKRRK